MTVQHMHILELLHTVRRGNHIPIAQGLQLSAVAPQKADNGHPHFARRLCCRHHIAGIAATGQADKNVARMRFGLQLNPINILIGKIVGQTGHHRQRITQALHAKTGLPTDTAAFDQIIAEVGCGSGAAPSAVVSGDFPCSTAFVPIFMS